MLKIKEALLNSSKTLLEIKQIDYQLENNSYISGLGSGEALAKYVGHLANDLKLNIKFANLSDLLDSDNCVTVISFDDNCIIKRIKNANIIKVADAENCPEKFYKTLYELTKQCLAMANKTDEVIALSEYIKSYTADDLIKLANEIESAVDSVQAKEIDYVGEGYETTLIDFARNYNANKFGSFSSFENSEDYHHINVFLRESENIYTPMIINSNASSVVRLTETVKVNDAINRKMVIIADNKDIETKSSLVIVKKALKPYFYSAIEGYAYLYLTALMVNKINESK